MEIWTDGTTVVQACDDTNQVRVFRSGERVGEVQPEPRLSWRTPLAVDPAADRIWAGNCVSEYQLSDLSLVTVHEHQVERLATLGDGRVAALLSAPGRHRVCRLAVGLPGAWEREVVLDDLHESRDPLPGLSMSHRRPGGRAIGGDPTLTATAHGVVVADGETGVVAHFTADLDLVGLWYAGGVDETELLGYAMAAGVLVTARWAGRDSLVGLLTADGADKLLDEYGAFAMPADAGRIWVAGNFDLHLLDADGTRIVTTPGPRGMIQAAHAAGAVCALGTSDTVNLAVAAADGITKQTIATKELVDVFAVFHPETDHEVEMLEITHLRDMQRNWSGHRTPDGEYHVHVRELKPHTDEDVIARLRTAGAVRAESVPHDFDKPRRRRCCE
ncbi:hypothetical protein [Yinghuangia sp. YIM S09857]|uniref:hypothetical protein n=1 Tax=Yinghuangia sp. YIM S09857 TaxID=3436929 RepID=UPI003F52CB3F